MNRFQVATIDALNSVLEDNPLISGLFDSGRFKMAMGNTRNHSIWVLKHKYDFYENKQEQQDPDGRLWILDFEEEGFLISPHAFSTRFQDGKKIHLKEGAKIRLIDRRRYAYIEPNCFDMAVRDLALDFDHAWKDKFDKDVIDILLRYGMRWPTDLAEFHLRGIVFTQISDQVRLVDFFGQSRISLFLDAVGVNAPKLVSQISILPTMMEYSPSDT